MKLFSRLACMFVVMAFSMTCSMATTTRAADNASWPVKPLRVIVGFPQGSAPDLQVRLLVDRLAAALGQPVNIDNRPGDSGNIGAALLAKEADDHTIGIVGNGQLTGALFRTDKLPFDPDRDFVPIALVASAPLVWIAKASPPRTAVQFIAEARAKGRDWTYGSTGPGSGIQLATEQVKHALGLQTTHTSFANGPLILAGVLSGQVQMALLPASLVMPLLESGSIQVIAVTIAGPTPLAPTLPALEGIGLRGVSAEVWNALIAPAGMSAGALRRLRAEIGKILALREVRRALFLQGWSVGATGPDAVTERVKKEVLVYRQMIPQRKP